LIYTSYIKHVVATWQWHSWL